MSPLLLCRERLKRIQSILHWQAGVLPIRDFVRSFHVWERELVQAAELGWVKIETHQPRTGRPSRIVRTVSNPPAAKLPPWRCEMEKPISIRHHLFAIHSTHAIKHGGKALVAIPCMADAYQNVFRGARNRRAATASASRLLRHRDVRAARAWCYARHDGDVPRDEPMPETANGIWQRLTELGSKRAAPRITIAWHELPRA